MSLGQVGVSWQPNCTFDAFAPVEAPESLTSPACTNAKVNYSLAIAYCSQCNLLKELGMGKHACQVLETACAGCMHATKSSDDQHAVQEGK